MSNSHYILFLFSCQNGILNISKAQKKQRELLAREDNSEQAGETDRLIPDGNDAADGGRKVQE
ncbi:MAG: hypothetical protein AAGA85_05600 [Bacteroidota bacterium]